ncbi:MAG TPA: lipoprotein [Hyphomicrobium sp.]|jgi:predicted small lipoprotein YifL|nr:lipoprotein [Hyphomicrobium sp.]
MAALLRLKSLVAVALFCAVGFSVAGCGVKGPLEPPPEAKVAGDAKSPAAHDPGSNSDAPQKPHEGFILDPLLR